MIENWEDNWDWINPRCGQHSDLDVSVNKPTSIYMRTFKIRENFPLEEDDVWAVRQGNRVVEKWRVDFINPKKTLADIEITEYVEDENNV